MVLSLLEWCGAWVGLNKNTYRRICRYVEEGVLTHRLHGRNRLLWLNVAGPRLSLEWRVYMVIARSASWRAWRRLQGFVGSAPTATPRFQKMCSDLGWKIITDDIVLTQDGELNFAVETMATVRRVL